MKTKQELLRATLLAIVLAFAMVSSAGAGAPFKRGNDRGKNDNRPAVSRGSDKAGNVRSQSFRRSESAKSSTVRDRGALRGVPDYRRGDDRGRNNDRPALSRDRDRARDDRSYTYRPSERSRPSTVRNGGAPQAVPAYRQSDDRGKRSDRPALSRDRDRKGDNYPYSYRPSERSKSSTMKDRGVPDARPGYRREDSSRYRSQDRWTNDHRYRGDRDDRKFTRVNERNRYSYRTTYRPPRYSGGFYYYYSGYPYYYDFPARYGYWLFDYVSGHSLRSIYFHYGYFPYVPRARVVIVSRPRVAYIEIPIVIRESRYYSDGYYLDEVWSTSMDRALSHIRSAWLRGDPDLLLMHVRGDRRIDVLLDGEYSYSVDGDDYRDMTRDAILSTDTVDFEFYSIRSRGDDRIVAYGRHEFCDPDRDRRTVYVSYELERRGGDWIVTEVGSSDSRY